MAQAGPRDRAHAVDRVAALEDEQRARRHRQRDDAVVGRRRARAHVVVVLVVAAADPRHDVEVAAVLGRLDREGDDEVGLVEVPLQLVALAHDREVERPTRVRVAVERPAVEHRLEEREQRVGLVEPSQRRGARDDVVADRADRVRAPTSGAGAPPPSGRSGSSR